MFKIESYVTPILLSYVDKYVRDFRPADAQVSLWGGGVALHNLVLKADVLQHEVALPFTLISGRIHELLIQVPWTKIMSEPIVVTIDTIECVLSLNPPNASDEGLPTESPKSTVVEAPPGYMQALVRRIVSNISLRVHHLIVKYVQDDIVLSLNVKHLCVESAGADWAPSFADIEQAEPVIRRLVRLDDLTLCLDRADSDGKIRFYQEPLLYRCQLDLRVLTRLISANTRRATCLTFQLRSTKLAWGVTSEQLTLLLRLFKERAQMQFQVKTPPPPPKQAASSTLQPQSSTTSNAAEPQRTGSWSEWAWSWMPAWTDREGDMKEPHMPPTPIPVYINAYLDHVSLVFKVIEIESNSRKRPRGVLELGASHAAVKLAVRVPTSLRLRIGVRDLRLLSRGKCVCGYQDFNAINEEPTIYLERKRIEESSEPWSWPKNFENVECKIEVAEVAEETNISTESSNTLMTDDDPDSKTDTLWQSMAPVVFLNYTHLRSPPNDNINPYDNPPSDFQYSDWVEENILKVNIEPIDLYVGMGFLHRVSGIQSIFQELPTVPTPDVPMRTLTVEECEALDGNIPQRQCVIGIRGLRLRILPWDHYLTEKQAPPSLALDIEAPEARLIVTGPLYPHRVCSAACQMPKNEGPLWQGARLHITAALTSIEAKLCSLPDEQCRPVARADLRCVLHLLQHPELFTKKETVHCSYTVKIREISTCGSAARLQAAWHILESLITREPSLVLRYTMLAKDALSDEESVALDAAVEDVSLRGFDTRTVHTHIVMVHSARVMALYSPSDGNVNQAWIFSAPDCQTTIAFFRVAVQWCDEQSADSVDYVGVWTQPMAFCADPLLIKWLAYKPRSKFSPDSAPFSKTSSTSYLRRRTTPPSSSGRGASRTGSGSELVHAARLRSAGSSSEQGEQRRFQMQQPAKENWTFLNPDRMTNLYKRLQQLLICVEMGTVIVYFTTCTTSAEGCAVMRDAIDRLISSKEKQQVLMFSMGRLTVTASSVMKQLWTDVRHDGPTFITRPEAHANQEPLESFPWKLKFVDLTCLTLEQGEACLYEDSGRLKGGCLKSNIKGLTRLVLETVTTTVTLSIVTKYMYIRSWKASDQQKSSEKVDLSSGELRMKYFTSGIQFKPSTLKEFVRGPTRRPKSESSDRERVYKDTNSRVLEEKTTQGPVVSIGVHLHADTPPVTVRLEQDQVNIVATAVHCLKHLQMLLTRYSFSAPQQGYTTLGGTQRPLIRSVSELNELNTPPSPSDDNISDSCSELVPLFQANTLPEVKLKTFFWFQWVFGRATLVVATQQSKLAMEVDDIIATLDIQEHYNQLKVKVASASIRHHKKSQDGSWEAGVLGGRVLVAREPIDTMDENHFLAVTITQAQISNLPASWKEELHPKLLQLRGDNDSMWEIYATLAPLEVVLQPTIIKNIIYLIDEMAPSSFCPLQSERVESGSSRDWQWPFCYVTAGGLRLLINTDYKDKIYDDTLLLLVGKISVSPHPDNPICRRSVAGGMDGAWASTGSGPEGRQYEINVKDVAIQSAQFQQILKQEKREAYNKSTGIDNPALKWSQPPTSPQVTSVLREVDIICILAPTLFVNGTLTCGPAVELNLASDFSVNFSLKQLSLLRHIIKDVSTTLENRKESVSSLDLSMSVCPYAEPLLKPKDTNDAKIQDSSIPTEEAEPRVRDESVLTDRCFAADSGIDVVTVMSRTNRPDKSSLKKNVTVAFAEEKVDMFEYLEVFVTMGVIELSLYTGDDGSDEAAALASIIEANKTEEVDPTKTKELSETALNSQNSLTELQRDAHLIEDTLDLQVGHQYDNLGNMALLHMTLHQPNLYYWGKKTIKSIQVSLFNASIGLGATESHGGWRLPLLSTAKGVPDPVTDIPPALATVKIVIPTCGSTLASSSFGAKGTVNVDVERPVLLELSSDSLRWLKIVSSQIQEYLRKSSNKRTHEQSEKLKLSPLVVLRKFMVNHNFENITIQMSQLGVSGSEGTVGWDAASLQLAGAARPERLTARAMVSALLVAAGPSGDCRHMVLQPLMLGLELESTWEAWRKVEGGPSVQDPSVRVGLDLDRIVMDIRPSDLAALRRIQDAIDEITIKQVNNPTEEKSFESFCILTKLPEPVSNLSLDSLDAYDQFYKDDLKSGAFKIVSGGQLPMAYQVTLYKDIMSWRYPHPRTITRIMVFPIPGIDEEVECVLEFYVPLLRKWEPHTSVTLPVTEPKEINLLVAPPDVVFANLWRFRSNTDTGRKEKPFEFDMTKFAPRTDPLSIDRAPEPMESCCGTVKAEQLSSALRVDSYFSPRLVPRVHFALRFTEVEVNAHNSLLSLSSKARSLEGYYVSRPLMRSHRVLSVSAADTVIHALFGSSAGRVLLFDTKLSCDVLDCSTGTMEQMMGSTCVQMCVSVPGEEGVAEARARTNADPVRVSLHVPRLSTLRTLAVDWAPAIAQYKEGAVKSLAMETSDNKSNGSSNCEAAKAAVHELEGRVSLWLHNSSASALRVGQEGCDEIVPLGPDARLAYRWPSPRSPFKLRFALVGPTKDWQWSTSIPFSCGENCVRLYDAERLDGSKTPGAGVFVHTRVETAGGRRTLHLSGRLVLANVLRRPLHYKVRTRNPGSKAWETVCSGELDAETVGRSILCGTDCEMVLKIKFPDQDTGWSGDIPLKECPKENVPWLVKVPSEGETTYMSVWCRVVRARSDGRVLAAVWPLYVLQSHLPLETEVLISTSTELSSSDMTTPKQRPSPLVQTAPGRGACTHLLAPGTTAARHQLSFQYKEIEHPVTREAIPVHYGVTDTSVFEKRPPVNDINEVIGEIREWFESSGREATTNWPYSIVTPHWPDPWTPAQSQPRCDVTVRYNAVRAGGGCSLQIQLRPIALLCNAARVALTMRAHDAAPLCRLEPGAAVAAPSALLEKPFFMSVELGRETFVSGQLQVWQEEPGRYGSPPRGYVALDHPTPFLVHCSQKVTFLTLYYEIKENINVLGVTSTFMLINRLDTDLLVSAVAVPVKSTGDTVLRPKTFKVVHPTKEGSLDGQALSNFWVLERWRGGDPNELRVFVCLVLPGVDEAPPAHKPVPVRLAAAPARRAVALVDCTGRSIPVVVVQQKHEGRWLVTVAPDPCPQFVVHNRTSCTLAVAQLENPPTEANISRIQTAPECLGTQWHCTVDAGAVMHYSTPAYCARFPPPPNIVPAASAIPFLTISKVFSESQQTQWSTGVAAAGGEQLLQLPDGSTLKLCVSPQPHSSLLELRDVDEDDISASDIRRRLERSFGMCSTVDSSEVELIKANATHRLKNQTEINNSSESLPTTVVTHTESGPDEEVTEPARKMLHVDTTSNSRKVLSSTQIHPAPTKLKTSTSNHEKKVEEGCSISETSKTENDDNQKSPGVIMQYDSVVSLDMADVKSYQEYIRPVHAGFKDNSRVVIEHLRCVIGGIAIEIAATPDVSPLLALHVDRASFLLQSDNKGVKAVLSVADIQVDNLQYETGQYDFAVVATTRAEPLKGDLWPPLWTAMASDAFDTRQEDARLLLRVRYDTWIVIGETFRELTEVDVRLGPLALYIEDGYVGALASLARNALPAHEPPAPAAAWAALVAADTRAVQCPLRLRSLHLHPLDLTLTLHTAVRMYIALDQSPLSLSSFQLTDMVTCAERLTHALTVHYLSAAILGAGWVVGGLELLGAPGALAARVGGARGGVRGVAAAAAAALLRSLSACAGSLARNLDLLAGDDEHARRAAAARRRHPDTFIQGLTAGITNFAINILGAVGGLAHHPLVGVAVGEVESSTTALRRGLLGALTKPLSATADLVAFAGHGLLRQTGWDPVPQWRALGAGIEEHSGGWRRDCVRWTFRLADVTAISGFDVLLDSAPLRILLTHKFLMVTDPETERIVEMIDLRFCTLRPYLGSIVELVVTQRRHNKSVPETKPSIDEDDEYQISAAAMARVARYTGADGGAAPAASEARVLALLPKPRLSSALHAALAVAIHSVSDDHLRLL